MVFPPLGNSAYVIVSVIIDSFSNSMGDTPIRCIAYDYPRGGWDGLCDHLGDVPFDGIFQLKASGPSSEFCQWSQVRIDVYISHLNMGWGLTHQMVSASCSAAHVVHWNNFFCLHQQSKSSKSIFKFRQARNCCKRVFESAKFSYAHKTKESITSQKLDSLDFCWIANSVLIKVKFAAPALFNDPRCCLLHLIRKNHLMKSFLRTLILMIQLSPYLFSLLELIWNCIMFL